MAELKIPPLPYPVPPFRSSSGLVVPPSTEIWNLSVLRNVFLFSHLTVNQPPKLNPSTFLALLFVSLSLSMCILGFLMTVSRLYSLYFQFYCLLHSSLFSAFPITQRKNKSIFYLLYVLNIHCTKVWSRTLSISLFKTSIKLHIYVDLDWFLLLLFLWVSRFGWKKEKEFPLQH